LIKKENYIKIVEVLDKMEPICKDKNIILHYTYNWSFVQDGERLSVKDERPFLYNQTFVYDFYGIMIRSYKKGGSKHKFIQFVILYDDDSHFNQLNKNIHTEDILKQYYLFQMNIHLLRLNKQSNIKEEIITFFRKIIKVNDYIAMNTIIPEGPLFLPVKKYLEDDTDLNIFKEDYKYNHILSIINSKRFEEDDANSEDEELIYDLKKDCTDIPGDVGYKLPTGMFKKILNKNALLGKH
jgi:hypothetical protein